MFSFCAVIALLGKTGRQEERLTRLEAWLSTLEQRQGVLSQTRAVAPPARAAEFPSVPEAPISVPMEIPLAVEPVTAEVPAVTEPFVAAEAVIPKPTVPAEPLRDSPDGEIAGNVLPAAEAVVAGEARPLFGSLLAFIRGGNLWAAGGVALLIAAFAMLVSYLARHGFFTVEMGIAAAALAGLGMLGAGWTLRKKRPVYFLILQGGGIGILYLSVFAAHKLTPHLPAHLPAHLAILLMTILIPPAIILALFQGSQPLAIFGFLGGYAAPVLLASCPGNHIFFFAYYTILCLGVLGTGFFRFWKGLNLLAFLCTFGAALYWVMGTYTKELFPSTEPFILGFILIFTLLGLRAVGRTGKKREKYFDAALILGTPFAAALLEWRIFSFIPHGYALVSIFFSALYLCLALLIHKKRGKILRIFAEGYLALGLLLANLVIPLELAPRITSAVWAAEGALIFLFGWRRGDRRIRIAALLVHAAAALAFAVERVDFFARVELFRSPRFIGSLIIALSALVMALIPRIVQAGEPGKKERDASFSFREYALGIWGFLWWYGGWLYEFNRGLPHSLEAFFILSSLTGLAFFVLALRFGAPFLTMSALPPLVLAFFLSAWTFLERAYDYLPRAPAEVFTYNFFGAHQLWPWLIFILVQPVLLVLFTRLRGKAAEPSVPKGEHSLRGLWILADLLILLGISSASGRYGTVSLGLSESWVSLAGLAPLFAVLLLLSLRLPSPNRFSFSQAEKKALYYALPLILSVILGLWFLFTLFRPGNPHPLPLYVPILNPLDLLEGFCVVLISLRLTKGSEGRGGGRGKRFPVVLGDCMAFLWLLVILERAFYFYGGVPWGDSFSRGEFHLALFILLAVYGILHIALGRRLSRRSLWIAGAVIIVTDIVKLLLFDLSETGTIPRIISFFAAALVLLFIGWAAPLPPKAKP